MLGQENLEVGFGLSFHQKYELIQLTVLFKFFSLSFAYGHVAAG
jgi:hypothetical protein